MKATDRPIDELAAGHALRETLVPKADGFANGHAPLWHGWALMEAFLAGIDYGRQTRDGASAEVERER